MPGMLTSMRRPEEAFSIILLKLMETQTRNLTLWANGGPGCSSVGVGAFTELGPFFPTGDGRGLRMNPTSWNKVSNLLFVESPVGVGWSYSNTTSDYIRDDDSTAKDMLTFLQRWYEKFPEYNTRDLFLTGESYAGHYIPQLADAILDFNEDSKSFKFNIKGLMLGNALIKANVDFPAVFKFYWSHGVISDEVYDYMKTYCDFDNFVYLPPHNQSDNCNTLMDIAYIMASGYIDIYDVILDVCYPTIAKQGLQRHRAATNMSMSVDVCMNYERDFYFNLPEVQKALHANRTNLPYNWTKCSNDDGTFNGGSSRVRYNRTDTDIDIRPLLKRVLRQKIPIFFYSGDQDSAIPFLGSRKLIRQVAENLKLNVTLQYQVWFHEEQVAGWTTEYANLLTFATVKGAGHMVPTSQPSRGLNIFSTFIAGKRLLTTNKLLE